jgi:hypothetical protein
MLNVRPHDIVEHREVSLPGTGLFVSSQTYYRRTKEARRHICCTSNREFHHGWKVAFTVCKQTLKRPICSFAAGARPSINILLSKEAVINTRSNSSISMDTNAKMHVGNACMKFCNCSC